MNNVLNVMKIEKLAKELNRFAIIEVVQLSTGRKGCAIYSTYYESIFIYWENEKEEVKCDSDAFDFDFIIKNIELKQYND